MKLKFLHISIENFLSLGQIDLDLNDMGYTLISGINNNPDDNAVSNGVGKSSIFDALTWCITGKTVRGTDKNITNIHTEGGTRVELTFLVDGKEYRICRYRDHKKFGNNIQIFIDGEDKSGKGIRDGEKLLSDYLPELTLQFIGSVIVFGQGLPQRFTNNTPSGRKEVLEKLSQSDFMIEDIKDRLNNRKNLLTSLVREKEDSLLSLKSQLNLLTTQQENRKKDLEELGDASQLLEEKQQLENNFSKLVEPLNKLKEEVNNNENAWAKAMGEKTDLCALYTQEKSNIDKKYSEELNELQQSSMGLKSQIQVLEKEIVRLKNIKDVCPTCGQKLPNVHKVDTTEQESEVSNLKTLLSEVDKTLSDLNSKIYEEKSLLSRDYEGHLLSADNKIKDLKEILLNSKDRLGFIEENYKHLEFELTKLDSKYSNYSQHKEYLISAIQKAEEEKEKMQSKILYGTVEWEDLKARLDVISKMITITTREFRGFLLSNVINYIQDRAKMYSKDIFGTDKIEFTLNGNNIDISYDNKMYENLSGGEAQKVNIIINLALRDMLCQFSNFNSNILVLDEIFDNLDSTGCSQIIDVITKRLTDIESVFIITHRAELMIPADSTIMLIKEKDGITRLQ